MNRIIFVLVLLSLALAAIGDESLTGSVIVGVSHEYKAIDGSKTLRDNGAMGATQNFSYGNSTTTAQVNGHFSAVYGLKSDTETVIDTQSLTDSFGATLAFQALKGVIVKNHDLTSTVSVGSSAIDSLFSATVQPGGAVCYLAPYAGYSTATDSKIYLNTGGMASCEISILGVQ